LKIRIGLLVFPDNENTLAMMYLEELEQLVDSIGIIADAISKKAHGLVGYQLTPVSTLRAMKTIRCIINWHPVGYPIVEVHIIASAFYFYYLITAKV
jgi:hypothetical protein